MLQLAPIVVAALITMTSSPEGSRYGRWPSEPTLSVVCYIAPDETANGMWDGTRIYLTRDECDYINVFVRHPRLRGDYEDGEIAYSLWVSAHEAGHGWLAEQRDNISGSRERVLVQERRANCFANRHLQKLARAIGASKRTARGIYREAMTYLKTSLVPQAGINYTSPCGRVRLRGRDPGVVRLPWRSSVSLPFSALLRPRRPDTRQTLAGASLPGYNPREIDL